MSAFRSRCVIRNCIEFVVPHYRRGGSVIDHRPDEIHNSPLVRASIDEITEEDDPAALVLVKPAFPAVAKLSQQSLKFVCLPMDISDDVVHLYFFRCLLRS